MDTKGIIAAGVSCIVFLAMAVSGYAQGGPLTQVIEGARKEKAVSMRMPPGFNIQAQTRLKSEIRKAYGVELKIDYAPTRSFAKATVDAIGEFKAGFSTYDIMVNSGTNLMMLIESGAVEKVDWLPLLPKGTPPEVIRSMGNSVATFTGHRGLMYNTKKVAASAVPKRWRDLADPKWRGRFGITSYGSLWELSAYMTGTPPESMLEDLRNIMKNKAMVGTYTDLVNRYMIDEIDLAVVTTSFVQVANEKGVPTGFASIEASFPSIYSLALLKRAKHPNAGKLVAAYLAGPEGFKITLEHQKAGNLFYPGNYEHDIRRRDQQLGLPVTDEEDEKLNAYMKSKGYRALRKKVKRILETGE